MVPKTIKFDSVCIALLGTVTLYRTKHIIKSRFLPFFATKKKRSIPSVKKKSITGIEVNDLQNTLHAFHILVFS